MESERRLVIACGVNGDLVDIVRIINGKKGGTIAWGTDALTCSTCRQIDSG